MLKGAGYRHGEVPGLFWPPPLVAIYIVTRTRARYARARSFQISCNSTFGSLAFYLRIRTAFTTDVTVATGFRIFRQKARIQELSCKTSRMSARAECARPSPRSRASSAVRNLKMRGRLAGSGVRHGRLCGRQLGRQRSQKFTERGIRNLRLRGRQRSQKLTAVEGSGVKKRWVQ